jgi:hypothetical protein
MKCDEMWWCQGGTHSAEQALSVYVSNQDIGNIKFKSYARFEQ